MTALSAILGLFSPLVFMLGAEPFEARGGNSLKEVLAGCVALALYLALCQFLVARSVGSNGRTRAVWSSSFAAMIAPLAVAFLAIVVLEEPGVVLAQGLPMLFAGGTGCLAGALAARWAPDWPGAHAESVMAACRLALRVAGGLSIVVAALLFFVIAPIVARDTSPEATPGPAARSFMVIAAFHLLLVGFSFWKTRSVAMPVASGVFGLVFGLFLLFMASVFSHHGPSIHSAVIALYVCAASDLLAGCSATAVATVGRGEPAPDSSIVTT
jgi:hypothetical protein